MRGVNSFNNDKDIDIVKSDGLVGGETDMVYISWVAGSCAQYFSHGRSTPSWPLSCYQAALCLLYIINAEYSTHEVLIYISNMTK